MEVSVMMRSIYSGYVRVNINKLLSDWFTAVISFWRAIEPSP